MSFQPKLPSVVELLSRLVSCPSTSGSGGYGEAGMVAIIEELLDPWADEIVISEPAPGRPNLVARFEGCETSMSYAFEAHSDTVGSDGMTIAPFCPEVRGRKLYGRGACDAKGPMTAMLLALLRHLRDRGRPPVTWYFVCTIDEELGGLGARHLAQSGFHCDGMVVAEPTLLQPVFAHKGVVRHKVSVRGVAAHSSAPEQGANAVHAAADFVLLAERVVANLDSPSYGGEPGAPTFSVGVVRGGDQVNRIPEEVSMETDFRLPPGMDPSYAEDLIMSVGAEVMRRRPRISFDFKRTQEYPSFALPADSPFRLVVTPLTGRGWHQPVRYATDAGFFAAAGIPCVVYGPGDISQAHTAEEWIELDQVEEAIVVLRRCIETAR